MKKRARLARKVRRLRKLGRLETLEPREMLAVDVAVNPFDHEQTFLGAGAGFQLYGGHLVNGVPADQREEVYDWLFEDLNLPILRMFNFAGEANGNDDDDPTSINIEAMGIGDRTIWQTIYQEALARNPDTQVMSYASTPPPHLTNESGFHDITKPNFYAEYAEWLYANLAEIKVNYGVDIAMVDLLNEPDLDGKVSREDAALIYANTVPILEELVAANYDQYGVEMPLITGSSNLTNTSAANWLTDFAENEPATWDAIDVLTTHLYGNNGFDQTSYETIADLKDADHPLFIQNEMEFGHESFTDNGRLPDDSLDNDLEGALSLARATAIVLEAGADAFHVFQGVSPQTSGAKSLVFTPWGQEATLRKGYHVLKQMTALQPNGSDVVTDVTTGAPTGFHTYAYNQWGDDRVYVNVVNATGSSETTNLSFLDNQGNPISFTRVTDYATDTRNDMAILSDDYLGTPATEWSVEVEANSVRTFVIELTQTGYSVPVGDMTYLVESATAGLNSIPQDDDVSPRTEVTVGYSGAGAGGDDLGILRALLEFDYSAAGIPTDAVVESGQLELWAYRGSVGESDSIGFDLYSFGGEFVESLATWLDPDGDGSATTGDTTPGGTLGRLLSTSTTYLGSADDYETTTSRSEIFHERIVLPGSSTLTSALQGAADGGQIRFALDPNALGTTAADFFGIFDENSNYAPELIVVTSRTDLEGPSVSDAAFRWATDELIAITFSEPIDTDSFSAEDLVVTNLTTGSTLLPSNLTILALTEDGVEFTARGLTSSNADWRVEIPGGVYADLDGNGNAGDFSFDFFRLVGDANRDRVVNTADYTIYRNTLGSTTDLRANAAKTGDSANVIDQADYDAWIASYGSTLPEPAPEPAAIVEAPAEQSDAQSVDVAAVPSEAEPRAAVAPISSDEESDAVAPAIAATAPATQEETQLPAEIAFGIETSAAQRLRVRREAPLHQATAWSTGASDRQSVLLLAEQRTKPAVIRHAERGSTELFAEEAVVDEALAGLSGEDFLIGRWPRVARR